MIDTAPKCRIISRYGVGLDNIDVVRATEQGILVSNVPDFCLEEVSDHTMALLLCCARKVGRFMTQTRSGQWDVAAHRPLPRLRGQTLGMIGFGNIARTLLPKAAGFGLKVLAYSPNIMSKTPPASAEFTNDLDMLLRESDYVSLHVPLNPGTHHLLGHREFELMKPTAYLINTARGDVIDESALIDALNDGQLAGAALDVLSTEPAEADNPLLKMENVIVTPHAAFYSETAIEDVEEKAARHVAQVLSGQEPDWLVNGEVLERPNCRLKNSN